MLRTKRGNRILALLLVVLIALSQTALASAEDGGTMVVTDMDAGLRTAPGIQLMAADNWSDEANRDTAWTDGAIATPQQLAQFAYLVNEGTYQGNDNVWLTADIDLAGKEWVSIGNQNDDDLVYKGTFNGNGFTVSNMTYSENSLDILLLYGLFGLSSANINAVRVTGTITIDTPDYPQLFFIGGIAGYNDGGTITNCISDVNININVVTLNGSEIGGIVGANYGTVTGCTNNGNIYLKKGNASPIGGITGLNYGTISRCANNGNLTGDTIYIGGIAGESHFDENYNLESIITNCYNTGDIKAIDTNKTHWYGGLAGHMFNSLLVNCYNAGEILRAMEDTWSGGLVGFYANDDDEEISNCYFLDTGSQYGLGRLGWYPPSYNIYENPGMDMGIKKTDTQMKTQDFVNALNTSGNVFMLQADGFPVLVSMAMSVTINTNPTTATVIVKQSNTTVNSEIDGTYLLIPGDYSVTVAAANYTSKTEDFTVTLHQDTHTVNIDLDILPADYSAVDAAIARVPSDLSVYTSSSVKALNDAISSVVRGKDITEQDVVDGYAKAINDAIDALYRVYTFTTKFGTFTGTGDLSGTVNGPYDKFVRLLIGVVEVDSKNYTVTEGSTVVTLKESYLKTLANGNYTVTAEFKNGTAETTLKVAVKTNTSTSSTASPSTGDNSIIWLWIALTASSLGSLGVLAVISKKRRKRKT